MTQWYCIQMLLTLTMNTYCMIPLNLNLQFLVVFKFRYLTWMNTEALQWRHNGRDWVSNHLAHDCLLNRLFRRRSKKTSKAPRHWSLWGEFTGDRWIPRTNGQKMFPFDDVTMNKSIPKTATHCIPWHRTSDQSIEEETYVNFHMVCERI